MALILSSLARDRNYLLHCVKNIIIPDQEDFMKNEAEVIFGQKGSGGQALRNHIIMEEVSSYLDDEDLVRWYDSSMIFKRIIEQMDESCWKKRTQLLAKALRITHFPRKTFREIFSMLRKDADILVHQIVESNRSRPLFLEEIRDAASLAHHGLITSLGKMELCEVNLSSVPADQLSSLAYCVKGFCKIENVSGCDLVNFLDSLLCGVLKIKSQKLRKEEIQAIVRAMKVRVNTLVLIKLISDPVVTRKSMNALDRVLVSQRRFGRRRMFNSYLRQEIVFRDEIV